MNNSVSSASLDSLNPPTVPINPAEVAPAAQPQEARMTEVFQSHLPRASESPAVPLNVSQDSNLDPVLQLRILIQEIKVLPTVENSARLALLVAKIAEVQLLKKDYSLLLSIFDYDNLAHFKSLPALSAPIKKQLLQLLSQIVRIGMQNEYAKRYSHQSIVATMQWLFESQTDLLSLEDEKLLAFFLMWFEDIRMPDESIEAVLPAILLRWQAMEITKDTLLVIFGLVALTQLPEIVESGGLPPEVNAAIEQLPQRLDSITDPMASRAVAIQLLNLAEISFFPRCAPERFLKAVHSCFARGWKVEQQIHTTIPQEMYLLAFTIFQVHFAMPNKVHGASLTKCFTTLISACLRPAMPLHKLIDLFARIHTSFPSAWKDTLWRQFLEKIGEIKLSIPNLQKVFATSLILYEDRDEELKVIRHLLLRLIKNVEPELLPADRFDFASALDNFSLVTKLCEYEPKEIEHFLAILVANFFARPSDPKQFYIFFRQLHHGFITDSKIYSFSLLSESTLSHHYRQQAKSTHPLAAFNNVYSLLVLALFIPKEQYWLLASEFLQACGEMPQNPEQVHEAVFAHLEKTIKDQPELEAKYLSNILILVLDFMEYSYIPTNFAQRLLSYLIPKLFIKNDEGEYLYRVNDVLDRFFSKMLAELIESKKWPTLAADADRVLRACIDDLAIFHSVNDIVIYKETEKLEVLLPRNMPNKYAKVFLCAFRDVGLLFQKNGRKLLYNQEFSAVAYLIENGYLQGVSEEQLFELQKELLYKFECWTRWKEDLGEQCEEVLMDLCALIDALYKEGFMDLFYDPLKKPVFLEQYESFRKGLLRRLK